MADKLNEVLPEILTPETTSTSTTTMTTTSTTTTTAPETTTLTIPPIEETVGIDWNPLENAGDSDHAPIFVGMETVEIAPTSFTASESKRSQSLNRVFQQQSTPSSSSQSQPKPFKSSQSEEVSQVVKSKAFKPS